MARILMLILILNSLVWSATYYLDAVKGDDSNPGTSEQPWKTLARAYDSNTLDPNVEPGDTVIIYNGNYATFDDKSNSRADWITYQAADGHEPNVSGIDLDGSKYSIKNQYFKFVGLKLIPALDSNRKCVITEGVSYIQFTDCNLVSPGLVMGGCDAIYLDEQTNNVDVNNCHFWGTGDVNEDPNVKGVPGFSAAVGCNNSTVYNITVTNCEIEDSGLGINIKGTNWTVSNCNIHDMYSDGVVMGNAYNITVEDCTIRDINSPTDWGIHEDGIQIAASVPTKYVTIRRIMIDMCAENPHQGMHLNPGGEENDGPYTIENTLIYNASRVNVFDIYTWGGNMDPNFEAGPNSIVYEYGDYNSIYALLADYDNGDYTLAADSNAIDFVPLDKDASTDLNGNGRVDVEGVGNEGSDYADAGVYEYNSDSLPEPDRYYLLAKEFCYEREEYFYPYPFTFEQSFMGDGLLCGLQRRQR